MLRKLENTQTPVMHEDDAEGGLGFRAALWLAWAVAVIVFAIFRWQGGIDLAGVVIQTLLVGLVGVIVMTLVEMRYEPERFVGGRDRW